MIETGPTQTVQPPHVTDGVVCSRSWSSSGERTTKNEEK